MAHEAPILFLSASRDSATYEAVTGWRVASGTEVARDHDVGGVEVAPTGVLPGPNRMSTSNRKGQASGELSPLACALVYALRSENTAKAWTHLRDVVCERVRAMRDGGESKAAVLNTLTAFARSSIHGELNDPKSERIAEELLAEVSLWCIDEYDGERPAAGFSGAAGARPSRAAHPRA